MKKHTLIGLDQMEPSVVRRRLHRWNKADEQAITPLIATLQQQHRLSEVHIEEPRWETNVCPLYYYWAYQHGLKPKEVYDRVFGSLPTDKVSVPEGQLRAHVGRVVDSEIDILVEDVEYFVFIEAKIVRPGRKVKFENGGIHQLVRQYVQGKILEQITSKTFELATIGVTDKAQMTKIDLNDTELALVQLVGEEMRSLEVVDLSWSDLRYET